MYLWIIKRTDRTDMIYPKSCKVKYTHTKKTVSIFVLKTLGKRKDIFNFFNILYPKKAQKPKSRQYSPENLKTRKESG
jgi:hypothetical protein